MKESLKINVDFSKMFVGETDFLNAPPSQVSTSPSSSNENTKRFNLQKFGNDLDCLPQMGVLVGEP